MVAQPPVAAVHLSCIEVVDIPVADEIPPKLTAVQEVSEVPEELEVASEEVGGIYSVVPVHP